MKEALAVHSAIGLSLLSAALFAASFPPVELGAAAWIAFVPLLLAARAQSARLALFLGWLTGTVGGSLLVSPSINAAALRYFADSPWVDMAFALIAPQFYGAIYFAAFAWVASRFDAEGEPARYVLVLASTWVLTEYLRSTVWHGCPWALLAHSQHRHLWVIQIADLAGTAGVGFVVITVNAAFTLVALALRRRRVVAVRSAGVLVMVMLLVVLVGVYGRVQLDRWSSSAGAVVGVMVVQGDIPPAWRATPAGNARALRKLEELTLNAAGPRPDLIVWPENAVGFAVTGNEARFGEVLDGMPPAARLLVGAPRTVTGTDGRVRFRNSAFLLAPVTGIIATYDKIRLTPYAEYSPLAELPWLRSRYASASLYSPGDDLTLLEVGGYRFGTMICFEAIYADLARDLVAAGATFLVNISNDDWFGGHAAVRQHFVAALFRSIETRRPMVRATNSGVTAIIDATGSVVDRLPDGRPLTLSASIHPASALTAYVRYGEVFVGACALFAAACAFGRLLAGRKVRAPRD